MIKVHLQIYLGEQKIVLMVMIGFRQREGSYFRDVQRYQHHSGFVSFGANGAKTMAHSHKCIFICT